VGAAAAARPGDGGQLIPGRAGAAAAASAFGLLVACAGMALAQVTYLQAVQAAESILAREHLSAADIRRANTALFAGVACSQPEITSDLTAKPPDVADAEARLQALDRALSNPPSAAPGVEAKLRSLANSSPYRREQPESPGELFTGWVQGREAALQAASCGGVLSLLLTALEYLAIAAVAVGAAIFAYRRLRSRAAGEAEAEQPAELRRPRSADQRFAAGDRLAAAGDFAAALRELASAVATVLGGEAAWEGSPLTVRELYARAGLTAELRPLLRGFEDTVYGHREVTRPQYEAAAVAAAPYRAGRKRAA
jgi:hypothetical protein